MTTSLQAMYRCMPSCCILDRQHVCTCEKELLKGALESFVWLRTPDIGGIRGFAKRASVRSVNISCRVRPLCFCPSSDALQHLAELRTLRVPAVLLCVSTGAQYLFAKSVPTVWQKIRSIRFRCQPQADGAVTGQGGRHTHSPSSIERSRRQSLRRAACKIRRDEAQT